MGVLKVNAVDARFQAGFLGLLLSVAMFARWDLGCGFCKERFRTIQPMAWSTAVCPYCRTRNLLPVPRFARDPGPRPPNGPEYQPPSE